MTSYTTLRGWDSPVRIRRVCFSAPTQVPPRTSLAETVQVTVLLDTLIDWKEVTSPFSNLIEKLLIVLIHHEYRLICCRPVSTH